MLTPLDLHNKEFRRSFRGFDCEDVHAYLAEVIDTYEILFQKEKWTLEQGAPITLEGKPLLTPLQIHNKEFKRALLGYDIDQVNDFLDLVIRCMELLIREKEMTG